MKSRLYIIRIVIQIIISMVAIVSIINMYGFFTEYVSGWILLPLLGALLAIPIFLTYSTITSKNISELAIIIINLLLTSFLSYTSCVIFPNL